MRHLDVGVLWLQEQQLKRIIELTKVSGTQNPRDLMTKTLAKDQINQYTEMLGFEFTGGLSETAAKLHSLISETTMRAFAASARWEHELLTSMSDENNTCQQAPGSGQGERGSLWAPSLDVGSRVNQTT